MHSAPQEAQSPARRFKERSSNSKLGHRIKATASSFATKLHLGAGHPSFATAAEHPRGIVQRVGSETQSPQGQVEEQLQQQKEQQQREVQEIMPVTPLRESEKEAPITTDTTTFTRPASSHDEEKEDEARFPSTFEQKVASPSPPSQVEASTSSEKAPPEYASLENTQILNKENPHKGTCSIPTIFSGIESPQRLSSDTDELKPTYIKPLPSLDRSTESQEVYVKDLETLAEGSQGRTGRAIHAGVGGKSAAQRLKHAGPALQPAVEEEEEPEEEQHTDAGLSPLYSIYKEAQVQGEEEAAEEKAEWMAAVGESDSAPTPAAALASTTTLSIKKEEEKQQQQQLPSETATKQENLQDEIYAAIEAESQLEKEEEEEDHAIATARRRVERVDAGKSGGIAQPNAEMTHRLESPSGKIVIPEVEVPDTIAVPRRGESGRAFLQAIQNWVFINPITLFLLIAGTASLARVAWVFFSSSTFKDFGPLLLLSGAVALVASVLASYTYMGGSGGLIPLPEDLIQNPEEGVLQKVEHVVGGAATAAKEGFLSVIDPGQEMVGEVIQETDAGEQVLLPDTEGPVHRAEDAVIHAAEKIKNVVAGSTVKESDVVGGGADPAVQKSGAGGYSSDSDVPGPVIEGIHRDERHHTAR